MAWRAGAIRIPRPINNYRKRDDDHDASSTTTDPCRRIRGRCCSRPRGRGLRRSCRLAPTIAACPGGESEDTFTGECTPDLVPNSPEAGQTSPGGLPEVDNIPCTGANSGQCIGLSEEEQAQGPMPVPHSTVSSSP